MGLKMSAVWQRLETLLAFHTRLREENKDKERMDKVARKIKRLLYLLEKGTPNDDPTKGS